ncbi:hypothetical protein H0H81_008412 [Sphagnurus paluster]|uniref:Uncharacterized protein n=1 Tax=Sphagnurus paluster TaxID=117069 RepID=A0A9P7K4A3_9AGAR|nr:hypothetical protein H0H81_008412 [Sphagnurus paluster]
MYGSTRKILALFVSVVTISPEIGLKDATFQICMTLLEALAMGLVFGLPNPKLIATNNPLTGVFICADADPMDGTHWVVYYWASILVIEGVLLLLALFKAWQHRTAARGSSLMQQLSKDSVIYFFTLVHLFIQKGISI